MKKLKLRNMMISLSLVIFISMFWYYSPSYFGRLKDLFLIVGLIAAVLFASYSRK